MFFGEVFDSLIQGKKIRRKDWSGFWRWENDTIMICYNGEDDRNFDIRETKDPRFTFGNIAADDWVVEK